MSQHIKVTHQARILKEHGVKYKSITNGNFTATYALDSGERINVTHWSKRKLMLWLGY